MLRVANSQRRWARIALCAGVAVATVAVARAQSIDRDRIDGIVVGPFVLAPSLDLDVEADSNVINAPPDTITDPAAVSASVGFSLDALLPFSNNALIFSYSGAEVGFDSEDFEGGAKQEGELELDLNFGSGLALTINERFRRDFAQVQDSSIPQTGPGFDPEFQFFGQRYTYNRLDVEIEGDTPAAFGFGVRLGRRDFIYDEGTVGTQFDYQGMENSFDFLQRLSAGRQVVVQYSMRRLNHFRDGEGLFRKEVSDSIEAGLSGVGGVRPFYFRVGYSRFFYKFPEGKPPEEQGSDFRGLAGFARWRLPFGGRSAVSLSLSRRPLPSNFDTFYITDQFRMIAERLFRPRVRLAALFGLRQNRYADEIPELRCGGLRKEVLWDVGFRSSWRVHPLLGLSLSGRHEERASNCVGLDFVSTSFNLGMEIGF
jgi:hypothetical protein